LCDSLPPPQLAINALAQHCRVVLLPEFFTSQRCATCRPTGDDDADFLAADDKRRTVACDRCHQVFDRDDNAAVNLMVAARHYMDTGQRPEYLDAPYAWRYLRSMDPETATRFRPPTEEAIAAMTLDQLAPPKKQKRKVQRRGDGSTSAATSAATAAPQPLPHSASAVAHPAQPAAPQPGGSGIVAGEDVSTPAQHPAGSLGSLRRSYDH
jgi:hypothetical protein